MTLGHAVWIALAAAAVSTAECPAECDCTGSTVDCSSRGLQFVPRYIPPEARRVNLEGNNITVIRSTDFEGLKHLLILQLMENQIHTIERGSFQDLTSMERLRLNSNRLKSLPDMLFGSMPNLLRLDLSNNKIAVIGKKTLRGSPLLKNLQMDNNEITCIDDSAIRNLKDLEILTLNRNNLTTLGRDLFSGMPKLRVLRLSDNPFQCDCRLAWMATWLRRHPRLGLFARCGQPLALRGQSVSEIPDVDLSCPEGPDLSEVPGCRAEPPCPPACHCAEGVVDCRDRGLTSLPDHVPDTTTELRLEQNQITKIPSKAFSIYKALRRIDLSNNEISYIAGDAFFGLKFLTSLVLYGNKITELPMGIFRGLSSLQLLLLNANKISCIRRDAFSDLHNLNLLSLYDNNIQTLANGTFDSLHNIQTLHLARNPFVCDCRLRWLAVYLHSNPIETSGARCETPRRVNRRRLSHLRETQFRCSTSSPAPEPRECQVEADCPEECLCEGTVVDCSRRELKEIPNTLPATTTELRLNDNHISRINNNGLFRRLPHLSTLDLRHNEIEEIDDEAFQGATKLNELLLNENKIRSISPKTFVGLKGVKNLMLKTNQLSCISNDTFTDMESVKTMSLYGNEISCIMPGTFDRLKSLSSLNLLSNPLRCDCHLRWMSDWLKERNIVTGNPKCQAPNQLRNVPIQDVDTQDFSCNDQDQMFDCGPPPPCPAGCTCTGTVVHCSRLHLKAFPRGLPPTTTELYLDVNDIAAIPEDINRLRSLQRLDLSNNQITIIPNKIFANLSSLATLIVSFNKLQCIQVDSFLGLKSLRILSLQGNDISMIPEGTFRELESITHIALGANPLYCDCELRWLAEWIKTDYIEPGIATCAEPRPMKDKLVLTAPTSSFICTGKPPEPEVLAKCDACYLFPCQNGGTCQTRPLRQFECLCAPGFHGPHCEYVIDACFGKPCENGGTCKVLEAGRFSCHCPVGFEGDRCEVNIDDCFENKCEHNSTCVDLVQEYNCQCTPGYTGNYCETKINYCTKEYNPCKNGATCIDHVTHYSCACAEGYMGDNCTRQACQCQNGGQCKEDLGQCQCPSGFGGDRCELEPAVLYPRTSPCSAHDCQNGGLCFQPPTGDYQCRCQPGFAGRYCEILGSLSFEAGGYLELDSFGPTKNPVNLTLEFSTRNGRSGILAYSAGQVGHVAAELFQGRIRASYDVGNHPVSTMFSYETVADGRLHSLQLILQGKNLSMRVDGAPARTVVNEGKKEFLEPAGALFLGGVPPDVASMASRQWHLRNATSFDGCLRTMVLNGQPLDALTARARPRTSPGCPGWEPPACQEHRCRKGRCVPADEGYECHCKQGWSGRFCDQAPSCQKEPLREYHEEGGCRSVKPLKTARCTGSCGDLCCRPQRVKRRAVRMACPDGSRFTTHVNIVRKCKCSNKC